MRNPGLGLLGYTFEEGGPALAAREGRSTLEREVASLAGLPFVDAFYIRCDWRDVQRRPGRLDLHPVFALTREAARASGRRFGLRVQLSNTEHQPQQLALPFFVREQVPLVTIRSRSGRGPERVEPRYDHPAFLHAFRDLNELLAAEFDADAAVEFVDLMMYGFWGEAHTSDLTRIPFRDYPSAERTTLEITQSPARFLEDARRSRSTLEPDISGVGNREVQDLAVRAGCWLRSDCVISSTSRSRSRSSRTGRPGSPAILEDGGYRQYRNVICHDSCVDAAGVDLRSSGAMLHALDLGSNYWSLWTEAATTCKLLPRGAVRARSRRCSSRIGYRLRPSWIWQRKRYGTSELIVASPTTASPAFRACCGSSSSPPTASSASAAASMPATRTRGGCGRPRSCCPGAAKGSSSGCGRSSS